MLVMKNLESKHMLSQLIVKSFGIESAMLMAYVTTNNEKVYSSGRKIRNNNLYDEGK